MVVKLPSDTSWTLLAWGYEKGGETEAGEMAAVIVDLDTSEAEISRLKQDGHVVICYFSVGTSEPARSDYARNKARFEAVKLKEMADWPEEYWLDISSDELKSLMEERFELAASKGCDGVEPDNVDCYDNTECREELSSSKEDVKEIQEEYNKWQIEIAHDLDLAIGLKNSLDLVDALVNDYDFAVSESCLEFKECGMYQPFFDQNKAVFHIEYAAGSCSAALEFPTMTKSCDGDGNICEGEMVNCFTPDGVRINNDAGGGGLVGAAVAILAVAVLVVGLYVRGRKLSPFGDDRHFGTTQVFRSPASSVLASPASPEEAEPTRGNP
mmetsp:Transcript_9873/g.18192  ORF Transcript_9873/g.18192 Transcript_9873/m.18192 type:complete len:326 (+) Transcript_9873:199-1176(+)